MFSTYAELIDEEQAAAILKLSPRTLQAWRVRGCGPQFVKVGRSVRYQLEHVEEYVKGNIRRSTSEKSSVLGTCVLTN